MQVACVWHTENMQKLEPNPDWTSQLSLTYEQHFNALLNTISLVEVVELNHNSNVEMNEKFYTSSISSA